MTLLFVIAVVLVVLLWEVFRFGHTVRTGAITPSGASAQSY